MIQRLAVERIRKRLEVDSEARNASQFRDKLFKARGFFQSDIERKLNFKRKKLNFKISAQTNLLEIPIKNKFYKFWYLL